jgi:hypothetical protein
MAVIPQPTYSPVLAPCNIHLFPKMKLKLKERWFDTIEEIQAESLRMLDTQTSWNHSKNEGDGGAGVYMWEGTTLRVMVANRPYSEF